MAGLSGLLRRCGYGTDIVKRKDRKKVSPGAESHWISHVYT